MIKTVLTLVRGAAAAAEEELTDRSALLILDQQIRDATGAIARSKRALALAMAQDRHGGGAFIRVIARAYAEKNDSLRKFLSEQYGHVLRDFAKAIASCVPGLSKEELYWRLDFLSGALTYAMADFGLIKRPSGVTEAVHRERAARELIRFASAGLKAGTN